MRLTAQEYSQINSSKKTKKKAPRATEKEIQAAIKKYLEWNGWYVIRHHQTLGSFKGMSDLTALKDGQTVYIEVKTPSANSKLSGHQQAFGTAVKKHGALYIVARSVDDVKFLCEAKGRS